MQRRQHTYKLMLANIDVGVVGGVDGDGVGDGERAITNAQSVTPACSVYSVLKEHGAVSWALLRQVGVGVS